MLPFTTDQFLGVFEAYNAAIWPLQVLVELLGLGVVAAFIWRPPGRERAVTALLAALWLLMGFGYHLAFFTAINPAAYAFAALFVAQGALFAIEGVWRDRIAIDMTSGVWRTVAAVLLAYALIVYPLIGLLGAQTYPATPLFGVAPCPTVIFTLAVLMLVRYRHPWLLAAIPLLWSIVGGSAAFLLNVPQDMGLVIAGVLLAIALMRGHCKARA